MVADEIFARADGLFGRLVEMKGAARDAASGQPGRVEAMLESTVRLDAAPGERAACAAELSFFASLPGIVSETVACLDEVKPIYLLAGPAAEQPTGADRSLIGRVFGRRRAPDPEPEAIPAPSPLEAQAAFAGRETRLASLFELVAEAEGMIPDRREFLEEAVFRLQERAVGLSASGRAAEPDVRREIFAVEELASELMAHSEALALQARIVGAIDRAPCGIEDDVAAAAEAHMDSLVEGDV